MIAHTNYMKPSGTGTAMFSRAGKTTIDQYLCFGDGTKTSEMAERHNRSMGNGLGQDGQANPGKKGESGNKPASSDNRVENYDSCFGNKLLLNITKIEEPQIKEKKQEELHPKDHKQKEKIKTMNRDGSSVFKSTTTRETGGKMFRLAPCVQMISGLNNEKPGDMPPVARYNVNYTTVEGRILGNVQYKSNIANNKVLEKRK
jgi:hypothetical protein